MIGPKVLQTHVVCWQMELLVWLKTYHNSQPLYHLGVGNNIKNSIPDNNIVGNIFLGSEKAMLKT